MSQSQQYTVLKTLKASSMPELLEDLNHNFGQLLNIYAVRGLQGGQGNPGQGGAGGVRGASFMILNIEGFQSNFDSPTDPNEITLADINNAVTENAVLFFQVCTNFDDIVHNDMLILPNGFVIQYDSVTGLFLQTRLRLYNTQDTWTREEIIQLIEEYSQNGDGLYRTYVAKNKIIADDSPNADTINSVYNPNAVADIGTSNSGAGFESSSLLFVAIQETGGIIDGNKVQLSIIDGHSTSYHETVQNTIAEGKLQSVPKADALPINVLLQNQHNSGFIFGSPELQTLDKFGHIRKSLTSLDIMPYYTIDGTFIANGTILSLSESSATLRSKSVILNSTETGIDLQTAGIARTRITDERTTIFNKPFFDLIKKSNQSVMSVLSTGEGVTVNYKTTGTLNSTGDALPTENVIVAWTQNFVNTRLGWSTPETVKFYLDDIYSKLGTLQTDLTVLKLLAGAFKGPKGAVLAYRGNTIPQGWQIVTDLQGRTIVGLDPNDTDFNVIGKKGGAKNIFQTIDQMPRHSHSSFAGGDSGGPYPSVSHSTGGNLGYSIAGTANESWMFSGGKSGNGAAMFIMNPHEVVNFIEFIG